MNLGSDFISTEEYDIRLSAHTINMILECPFKYYLYINGMSAPVKETKYIAAGQAVHAYMEDLFTDNLHDDNYYIWAEYIKETDRSYVNKSDYVVPTEMLDRFFSCKENGTQWFGHRAFQIEVPFSKLFTTPKGRRILLTGRIDAQDDDVVIDWKTGRNVVDNESYFRQAHIYDFATDFKKKVEFISLLKENEVLRIQHSPEYVPMICDEVMDIIEDGVFLKKDNIDYACMNFCENYDSYCAPGMDFIQLEDLK